MSLIDEVSEQLRSLASGADYKQVAEATGIERSYVNRIFNGKRNLTLSTLERIAHFFGRQVRFSFVPIRPEKPPEK